MTRTASGMADLRAAVRGEVVEPGDAAYDTARRIWNGAFDRYPAAVVRCTGAADVAAALAHAQRTGVEVTVRGGGHSIVGSCIADGALLIDLGPLDHVVVDPAARTARVGPGATQAQVDAATQEHGLALPSGMISHTGISGLTLGGGMGWLTRKFGLTLDNLLSVRIVTVDGRLLRAADDENPDLFWAVRGGGGNFGVVTEFEFRLHPLAPMVEFGFFFFPRERGAEVLRVAGGMLADLPTDLYLCIVGLTASPVPFVPPRWHGELGFAVMLVGFDGTPLHERVAAQLREALVPAFEFVTPMPFTALQQITDRANAPGVHAYEKGTYVAGLGEGAIAAITENFDPGPASVLIVYQLDGAYCDVADDATAFGGTRDPQLGVFLLGITLGAEGQDRERAWVRALWTALQPHSLGASGYVNTLAADEPDRVRAAYGPKYARLARIKAEYDPANLLRHNANIAPA